jgi:cytochrome P450
VAIAGIKDKRQEPPGPEGSVLFGSFGEMRRDPLRFYMNAREQWGDVVRFRSPLPFPPWYFIAHPADIEAVLKNKDMTKGVISQQLRVLTGNGLITNEGESWRQQRRLAQPAFHRSRLVMLSGMITDAAAEMTEEWQSLAHSGKQFDMMGEMMRLTLKVIGQMLFSVDLSDAAEDVKEALEVALEYVTQRSLQIFPLPVWVPTPRNLQFRRELRRLDKLVIHLIEERRRSGEDCGDLLSMLLAAVDEESGASMSDQQLRDEIITLVLAGHETTALVLTWTWYLLAQHPEAERKLQSELESVLAGRPPSVEELPSLPYTRLVIEESMRLYPPAWAIGRQTSRNETIRGYAIQANSPIIILPYVTHRHPDFWDNPDRFDPERFLPERAAGRPRFAYFPFGGGQRLCIGSHLAMMEAQLILATLAQRFRVRLVPGQPVELDPLVTLRPRYGILATLETRQ